MSEQPKRPSFQFYPGDWLHAADLRSCSLEARGLWIDLLCLMHQGEPYGYLKVGGKVILPLHLTRLLGVDLRRIIRLISELRAAGVLSQNDSDGCIFSRRMVRDEKTRQLRAAGGSKGGNPALIVNREVGEKDKQNAESKVGRKVKQNPTPSSSSSSSSSRETPTVSPALLHVDAGSPPEFLSFWSAYPRKEAKGKAEQAFSKLDPGDRALAVAAAAVFAAAWKEAPADRLRFIPLPASWLNAQRWLDDPRSWQRSAGNGSSPAPASPKPKERKWTDPDAPPRISSIGRLLNDQSSKEQPAEDELELFFSWQRGEDVSIPLEALMGRDVRMVPR